VPALIGAAHAPAERDPVLVEVEVLGVEVGSAQVVALRVRAPAAEPGQGAELGHGELAVGVVFLLGFQMVTMAACHVS
jgi:hypothetical protein